uniref:RRM domain-containing protein n=1 Tax=Oryza punctata TaxID=4537 RepID=A0A0E0LF48_ORYPU
MAAVSCRCSSVVFVGNISYQATEAEVRDACEEIGPVVSLRLAVDRDTGNPRGFAFVQYLDDETARSACRNLDRHALRGRALRVDLADLGAAGRPRGGGDEPDKPVGVEDATHAASLVKGATPSAAVTAYLAGLSRRQLRETVHAVEAQGDVAVERMKRVYAGLATLIEQARILLDMADAATAADHSAAAKRKKRGARDHHHGEAQKSTKNTDVYAVSQLILTKRLGARYSREKLDSAAIEEKNGIIITNNILFSSIRLQF